MSRQGHLVGSTMGAISIQIVPAGRIVKGLAGNPDLISIHFKLKIPPIVRPYLVKIFKSKP